MSALRPWTAETEFNVTRTPKSGCADICKKHQGTIERMRAQRRLPRLEAVCMLSHTGPETLDALMTVACAVNELDKSSSILMIRTDRNGRYTIAGALYTDLVINPDLDDEAADSLYRTIIETAMKPLLRPPGCTISWNPSDTVTANLMKPYAKNPTGPHTPSVH